VTKPAALNSNFLFSASLDLGPGQRLGKGPLGGRVIGPIIGGSFEGPRVSGKVLAGGGDWLVIRADGSMAIDVRVTLQADDGTLIYVAYAGRMVVPPALMPQLFNPDTVESVDPEAYYFRTTPLFEVAVDSPLAWLNGIVAVAVGRMRSGGIAYQVYEIT